MARGAIIGTADPAQFSNTTSTFSSSNGTWYFPMVAAESGVVDTILARMNAWNTTTQAKFGITDNVGNILAVGTAINTNGLNVSLSVTPFNAVQGQTYFGFMIAASGSPRPYQDTNAITNQVNYITASTFAATQNPLQMGTATQSALRKFHIWAEGEIGSTSAISNINGGNPVTYGQAVTWTATGFSPNTATVDGVAASAVSASGMTMPALIDGQTAPRPGSRAVVASEGANIANATTLIEPPTGFQYVQLTTQTTENTRVTPPEAVPGDHWMVETKDNTIAYANGTVGTNHVGPIITWLIKNDTKIAGQYEITFGPEVTGIISVGTEGVIRVDSGQGTTTNAINTSGFGDLTEVIISSAGGINYSAVSVNAPGGDGTFIIPFWKNGQTAPYLGPVQVSATDGDNEDAIEATLAAPPGYQATTFASLASSSLQHLQYWMTLAGNPLVNGERIYYPTANGFSVNAASLATSPTPGEYTVIIHRSDFRTELVKVRVGAGGFVVGIGNAPTPGGNPTYDTLAVYQVMTMRALG